MHPARIICLGAESVETLYRLGCGRRLIGVTGFAVEPPAARRKPRVSGFSSVNHDKIDALKPDLVITFSDVQADACRELVRRGHTVLATNPRSLAEIFDTIRLVGRVVGRDRQAEALVGRMQAALAPRRSNVQRSGSALRRPRIYFEEWPDPLISGIRWVSELIEAAGGRDIFSELRDRSRAPDRVVSADEVVRRRPDVIIASWCGRKANLDALRRRPGWNEIPAVRNGRVYEIPSKDILQPGPGLMRGFRKLQALLPAYGSNSAR